ncbi:MAG: hypothetical protein V3U24_07635 [Candidatus Neomarinimicrobiota bacterium]
MNTLIVRLILSLLFVPLWAGIQEEEKETVKYFKTKLRRQDILKNEISSEEARLVNHFKLIYDHKGELISAEFIPNGDRRKERVGKSELFPRPKPPFRYFESWNYHMRLLESEVPENEVGDTPFYRAAFQDTTHVKTVEYLVRRNRLLWTFYVTWDEQMQDSKLSLVFSTHQPLTALDPHLFHPTASEMRPGWVAEFEHNRLGRPVRVTVRDSTGNDYYAYKFKHSFETVTDTTSPVTYRRLLSEYYRPDGTLLGSHRLTFTEANSLVKKEFFDSAGNLSEWIEYIYNPKLNEVSVVIRDPKGTILHREVIPR